MRMAASIVVNTYGPLKIVAVKEDCGSLLEHRNYDIDDFVRSPNDFVAVFLMAAD